VKRDLTFLRAEGASERGRGARWVETDRQGGEFGKGICVGGGRKGVADTFALTRSRGGWRRGASKQPGLHHP